jgi:hypothetical protein
VISGSSSVVDAHFVTTIIKNISSVPISIESHTVTTEGRIVLTQDFNAALETQSVNLAPGDFTTILLALADPRVPIQRPNDMVNHALKDQKQSQLEEGGAGIENWVSIFVNASIRSDTGFQSSSSASYPYHIPFIPHTPIYKIDLRFAPKMTVGILSELFIDFYLPVSPHSSSPSFASFYRILFDPMEWVVTGRTYGRVKIGNSSSTLGLVPLTATAAPPKVQIEEYSNASDPKSKIIVAERLIATKYAQSNLLIIPPSRVSSICREVHNN